MTLLYDKYNAMVTAAWPTGIIAKPTVFNYNLKNWNPPNTIGHQDVAASLLPATADTSSISRSYEGILHIFAKDTTDLEKLLEGNLNMFETDDQMWISQTFTSQEEYHGYVYGTLSYGLEEVILTTGF